MRRKFAVLIVALSLLSSTGWSQEYSLTNLGTLGGNYSAAFSVNNSGQVVGRSELPTVEGVTPMHPFLYSNGTMIDLGTLGGVNGGAVGVNQNGDVTGDAETADGVSHAFLWNGAMQNLDPQNQSGGGSINATDAVTGLEGDPQAGATGVLFSGGAVQVIPHAPFDSLLPRGINNSGQIVGVCLRTGFQPNRACLITGNTVKAFQPLAGNTFSEGYAINAAGDVCGVSFEGTQPTTATFWSSGSKVNLGQLPNGTHSECDGLNDFGQEVGNAIPQSGTALRAVLFDGLNGARNLNQLIAHTPSLVLTQAFGISNTGYIVVLCQFGGTSGETRACLLKPNAVLILKKNIFALEQNDPGCIQCRTILDPEADSLPDTLTDLTPEQQKRVVSTVDTIIVQLRRLERAGQITAPQARLLVHQSQLVIAALSTT